MYQNTISSAYPVINPVQMQAPVTVNMPPQGQMPQVVQQVPMPQPMPLPQQMPPYYPQMTMQKGNFQYPEAPLPANAKEMLEEASKSILLKVERSGNDEIHISSERPKICDGNTYYIKQNGTFSVHSGWTGMQTIVENCPVMADIYSRLASSLSLNETSMRNAANRLQ